MNRYIDKSTALKLVVAEPESTEVAENLELSLDAGDQLVASWLLFAELHWAADRRRGLSAEAVNGVLDAIVLVDVERDDIVRAGTSSWGLRGADAIHLATAIRVAADEMVSFDAELAEAARRSGMTTCSPGRRA